VIISLSDKCRSVRTSSIFACLSRKLVVEVDGGQHAENLSDKRRDGWLRMQGFEVLRFWNSDVLKKTEGVLALILEALEHRPSPGALRASSSPRRGEVKDLGSH
jgi:very-short-patch-repair endonuclease